LHAGLAGLDAQAQNALLTGTLKAHGLLPPEMSAAAFGRFIELYRANAQAAAAYAPLQQTDDAPPLEMLVIRAAERDPDLDRDGPTPDSASDSVSDSGDPALGWRDYSSGRVRTAEAPGTHLSVFAPENVANLAAILNAWMAELDRGDVAARPEETP